MIETWRSAVAAGDPGWQHTARANVAAWQNHDIGLKAVFSHQGKVLAVAFSPDGKAVFTRSDDKSARIWTITELPDDLPRLSTSVELVTGLQFDEQGSVRTLDGAAWQQRRERLGREGGPPETGRRWRLDPILFGSEPTARARAWIERERWAEAGAAFNEVVLARPFDTEVLLERARFHAARSRPDKAGDDSVQAYIQGSRDSKLIETIVRNEALFHRAIAQVPDSAATLWSQRGDEHARSQRWAEAAVDYGQAARLQPEDLTHIQRQILSHAAAGDLDELSRVRSDLLDRLGPTTDQHKADNAAWSAALAPGLDAHVEAVVRLAECAVKPTPNAPLMLTSLDTLGAALYRAGRFEDAIRRLEASTRFMNGVGGPKDWVFLAMAHHRLGHRDQAHLYLERLHSRQPSTHPNFWYEVEIRLLQNEAEATILYDPVFPADPFAH